MTTVIIQPDQEGPWRLRRVLITHTERNEEFVANYFNGDNSEGTGLNLRRSTENLTQWQEHNQVLIDSAQSGQLVWRVKRTVADPLQVEHIEIWRDSSVIDQYWRGDTSMKDLGQGLSQAGFSIALDLAEDGDWHRVSPIQAMSWYKQLCDQADQAQGCVINTRWIKQLNPVDFTWLEFDQYMQQHYPDHEFTYKSRGN